MKIQARTIGTAAKEPYIAPELEMPTPAVVQSLIQPPTNNAVKTPARNAERKLTGRFGIIFRRTENASEEKINVMKKPNRRDMMRLTKASPTHRV